MTGHRAPDNPDDIHARRGGDVEQQHDPGATSATSHTSGPDRDAVIAASPTVSEPAPAGTGTGTGTGDSEGGDPAGRGTSRALTVTLVAVIAAAALVLAGTGGWLLRGAGAAPARVGDASVDAGFARDMSTHHTQAVTMAGYERDTTGNPQLRVLAFDIETAQQFQVGQMQGWLDTWGLPRSTSRPAMAWMPAAMTAMTSPGPHSMPASMTMTGNATMQPTDITGATMPGMASPAQMIRLETLRGPALDVLFLQLMIRHHQGGIPMARYAAAHASTSYARDLANKIVSLQVAEVTQMQQLLRRLGGTALPPPGH